MELLTPDEMGQADRITIADGTDGYALMLRAGEAVCQDVLRLWPQAQSIAVLCGSGNNGGDGYVAARLLQSAGRFVTCYYSGKPVSGGDAAKAEQDYLAANGQVAPLERFSAQQYTLVIDAIFGAGLCRAVDGAIADCIEQLNRSGVAVCAVDLPSGVSGLDGQVKGIAVQAQYTVTFFRKKPGHLLQPGRTLCGTVSLCNIGIAETVLEQIKPCLYENLPQNWTLLLPVAKADAHKFSRGHVAVFSGDMLSTGAARLSAAAAARSGAGLVTILSPQDALPVHAAHLTATMLRVLGDDADVGNFIVARKVKSGVLGPAFGDMQRARALVCALLENARSSELRVLVVDADGITAFKDQPQLLFNAARQSDCAVVLTPHEGEFRRLFGGLIDEDTGKVEKARIAARLSNCVVIYKGADTVIAAPDGRAAINSNGHALLATAGSGDVLTGIVAGLCAQAMPVFEAACAAVWMHAQTANCFAEEAPYGLTAEDMPDLLLPVWRGLKKHSE